MLFAAIFIIYRVFTEEKATDLENNDETPEMADKRVSPYGALPSPDTFRRPPPRVFNWFVGQIDYNTELEVEKKLIGNLNYGRNDFS